jgi:hypothetical protein
MAIPSVVGDQGKQPYPNAEDKNPNGNPVANYPVVGPGLEPGLRMEERACLMIFPLIRN